MSLNKRTFSFSAYNHAAARLTLSAICAWKSVDFDSLAFVRDVVISADLANDLVGLGVEGGFESDWRVTDVELAVDGRKFCFFGACLKSSVFDFNTPLAASEELDVLDLLSLSWALVLSLMTKFGPEIPSNFRPTTFILLLALKCVGNVKIGQFDFFRHIFFEFCVCEKKTVFLPCRFRPVVPVFPILRTFLFFEFAFIFLSHWRGCLDKVLVSMGSYSFESWATLSRRMGTRQVFPPFLPGGGL